MGGGKGACGGGTYLCELWNGDGGGGGSGCGGKNEGGGGDSGGDKLLLLLMFSLSSFSLFSLFCWTKSNPGGPGAFLSSH